MSDHAGGTTGTFVERIYSWVEVELRGRVEKRGAATLLLG